METKEEIYEDLLRKSGNISKSQKRHLRKVASRRAKSIERQKRGPGPGPLTKNNNGTGTIELEYAIRAAGVLLAELKASENAYLTVRSQRPRYLDLVLRWPRTERTQEWSILKTVLEIYWDNKSDPADADVKIKEYVQAGQ